MENKQHSKASSSSHSTSKTKFPDFPNYVSKYSPAISNGQVHLFSLGRQIRTWTYDDSSLPEALQLQLLLHRVKLKSR